MQRKHVKKYDYNKSTSNKIHDIIQYIVCVTIIVMLFLSVYAILYL